MGEIVAVRPRTQQFQGGLVEVRSILFGPSWLDPVRADWGGDGTMSPPLLEVPLVSLSEPGSRQRHGKSLMPPVFSPPQADPSAAPSAGPGGPTAPPAPLCPRPTQAHRRKGAQEGDQKYHIYHFYVLHTFTMYHLYSGRFYLSAKKCIAKGGGHGA